MLIFPRIYSISNQNSKVIKEIVEMVGGRKGRASTFRRNLMDHEITLLVELFSILQGVFLVDGESDRRVRNKEPSGIFSCRILFSLIQSIPITLFLSKPLGNMLPLPRSSVLVGLLISIKP